MSNQQRNKSSKEIQQVVGDAGLVHADWAAALREGVLLGQECTDCGHVAVTPKAGCTRCGSHDLQTVELPDEGTVYSKTTIGVAPEELEGGYQIAIVEVGSGRVMARIDGEVDIGDEVERTDVFEHQGNPAPVFRPAK